MLIFVEKNVERNVEQNVERNVERNVEQNVEQNVGQNVEQNVGQNVVSLWLTEAEILDAKAFRVADVWTLFTQVKNAH